MNLEWYVLILLSVVSTVIIFRRYSRADPIWAVLFFGSLFIVVSNGVLSALDADPWSFRSNDLLSEHPTPALVVARTASLLLAFLAAITWIGVYRKSLDTRRHGDES